MINANEYDKVSLYPNLYIEQEIYAMRWLNNNKSLLKIYYKTYLNAENYRILDSENF